MISQIRSKSENYSVIVAIKAFIQYITVMSKYSNNSYSALRAKVVLKWLAVLALPLEVKVLIPEPSKLFSTEAAAPKLFQRLIKFYELKHLDEKADWHFFGFTIYIGFYIFIDLL